MSSELLFALLVLAVAVTRVVELGISAANEAWKRERGGVEVGARHFPVMAVVHGGFLVSCLVEVTLADRPFLPWLGWPALAAVVAATLLRWWSIRSLGRQWSTRVVVVPGMPLVTTGPYRWLRHPNYVAVAVEIAALPLVHSAWLTALVFSLLDAAVLAVRLRAEEAALAPERAR